MIKYEVKSGVEKCERIDNGKTEWSFWADVTIEGQVRELESNCFYETEDEALEACKQFTIQFPIAACESAEKAFQVLDRFEIGTSHRKDKNYSHLSVVK